MFPEPGKRTVTFGRDRGFAFDHVFGQASSQDDVFVSCGAPLVDAVFDGYVCLLWSTPQKRTLPALSMSDVRRPGRTPEKRPNDGKIREKRS